MSVFDGDGIRTTGPAGNDSATQTAPTNIISNILANPPSQPGLTSAEPLHHGVDPHREARAIVRLIQCSQCSLLLHDPLTLPCGNSLCRKCLPELHTRPNISYPNTENRREGFTCPFKECDKDHSLDDCSLDITLAKVVDRVSVEVVKCRMITIDTPTLLDERPHWKNIVDSCKETRLPSSRILDGGRLLATYTLAEMGELKYDSEVAYQTMSPTGDTYEHQDIAMLSHLKEATKSELDCQVCYSLLLDPLTTNCGHTFCRKCVARILDHSSLCPFCRRTLFIPPGIHKLPGNVRLAKLLDGLCPDLVAARMAAASTEEAATSGERNVPLFVCTLAYPTMPTFLHIFEPRYRLMVRRAIESGDRKFGMLMYNQRRQDQGDLGQTIFMQYGTLLHIRSVQMLPDGRSLLETQGVSRFRVRDWGEVDGYLVGNVETLNDMSIAEEEEVEARETSQPTTSSPPPVAPTPPNMRNIREELDHMSTQNLLRVGTDFIARMRAASAPWLESSVIASYGPHSDDDPALFPYWFASVLPISDEEKYKLLPTASVRERLKITAGWVRRIEAQRWPPISTFDPTDGSSPSSPSSPSAAAAVEEEEEVDPFTETGAEQDDFAAAEQDEFADEDNDDDNDASSNNMDTHGQGEIG